MFKPASKLYSHHFFGIVIRLIPIANRTIPMGKPTMDSMSADPSMNRGVPSMMPDIEIRSACV
jgi:hypothetical protein